MIEVGEYIRSSRGEIIKIENEIMQGNYMCYFKNSYCNIKAHSKNIIDLIEVGDIVKIDNKLYNIQNIEELKEIDNRRIEEILTHEQYEQNCYKVVE